MILEERQVIYQTLSLPALACSRSPLAPPASAHHGWAGNSDRRGFELTGTVETGVSLARADTRR